METEGKCSEGHVGEIHFPSVSELARTDDGETLPAVTKPIDPTQPYAGVPRLVRFLRLVGDLSADAIGGPVDIVVQDGLIAYIGATSVAGLFVNTGHGHLGWTQAAGSASLLAQLISGAPTAIDPRPYALTRTERRAWRGEIQPAEQHS